MNLLVTLLSGAAELIARLAFDLGSDAVAALRARRRRAQQSSRSVS